MISKLRDAFKIFREKKSKEEAIKQFIKELQKTLISADVDIKTVISISEKVKKKIEQEYIPGIDVELLAKKVVLETLMELLGSAGGKLRLDSSRKPNYILLVGLYGHGKTTTAAKLAVHLRSQGYRIACLGLDVHRPAAFQQLRQLCEKVGIPVYGSESEKDPGAIIQRYEPELKKYDVVIVDTAGRDDVSDELLQEIERIYSTLQPIEVLLVIDAAIGRVAGRISRAFSERLPITGIVLTKMDSSARAGGALVAASVTGAPVKFIGTGEHLEDLEPFDPRSYLQRVLGLGDIQGLIQQINSMIRKLKKEELDLEESAMRILQGKMLLKDFYLYLRSMVSESPFERLASFIPLPGLDSEERILGLTKERLKRYLVILQSFRESELLDHRRVLRNRARLKKIAIGSGTSEEEVLQLLKDFERMRSQMLALLRNRELRVRGPYGRILGRYLRELK
jgi:signal recognition particle subunit SRP54